MKKDDFEPGKQSESIVWPFYIPVHDIGAGSAWGRERGLSIVYPCVLLQYIVQPPSDNIKS